MWEDWRRKNGYSTMDFSSQGASNSANYASLGRASTSSQQANSTQQATGTSW